MSNGSKKGSGFIVRENSPAFNAIKKFQGNRQLKAGRILPVNDEEFRSFQKDFIQLEIQK